MQVNANAILATLAFWPARDGLHIVEISRDADGFGTVRQVGVLWVVAQ